MSTTKSKTLTAKQMVRRSVDIPTRRTLRVGRNEPCPCGSGQKYKDCHQPEGDAYLFKLHRQQEKARIEAEQKEAGVSWLKRFISRIVE